VKALLTNDALPHRAPLPSGVPNYFTPRGLRALRAEPAALHAVPPGLNHHALATRRAEGENSSRVHAEIDRVPRAVADTSIALGDGDPRTKPRHRRWSAR
jgi:hypothetical protein